MKTLFTALLPLSSCLASLFVVMAVPTSAFADSFQFSLLPNDGSIMGAAGAEVGWGYEITNQSSSEWLVTTDLIADSFVYGTPNLLFDFPDVPPGQTITETFDETTQTGLYSLLWDVGATSGYINTGFFVLSSQWWDGDPFNSGNYLVDAPDVSIPYSATVTSSGAAPEPTSVTLFEIGLLVLAIFGIKRKLRVIVNNATSSFAKQQR